MAAGTPRLQRERREQDTQRDRRELTYRVPVASGDDADVARAAVAALAGPTGYVLMSLAVDQVGSSITWFDVVAGYEVPVYGVSDANPLSRPSILGGSWSTEQKAYFLDTLGHRVINSAGDKFETLPVRDEDKPILEITKNLSSYPLAAYNALRNTRNASAITIRGTTYDAGSLRFKPPVVREVYEQVAGTTYHYYATTFRLLADAAGHVDAFDDEGYFQADGKTVDDSGNIGYKPLVQPASSPWPLNGLGAFQPTKTTAPATLLFYPYGSAEWGIDFS